MPDGILITLSLDRFVRQFPWRQWLMADHSTRLFTGQRHQLRQLFSREGRGRARPRLVCQHLFNQGAAFFVATATRLCRLSARPPPASACARPAPSRGHAFPASILVVGLPGHRQNQAGTPHQALRIGLRTCQLFQHRSLPITQFKRGWLRTWHLLDPSSKNMAGPHYTAPSAGRFWPAGTGGLMAQTPNDQGADLCPL